MKTYDELLEEELQQVPDDIAKTEGSLVFNALSALAIEMQNVQMEMHYITDQMYADTADMDHLIKMAKDRGIEHRKATPVTVELKTNVEVPIGFRTNLEVFNYKVVKRAGENTYLAVCEEPGIGANALKGETIPIDYVDGLEIAEITKIIAEGREDEDIEHLRKRYLESFSKKPFGGNIEDYKQKMLEFDGIGGSKIYRATPKPGEVTAVVISDNGTTVSKDLCKKIELAAIPARGDGYGFAPIGHLKVHVKSAVEKPIEIESTIIPRNNAQRVDEKVKDAIEEYFLEVAKDWSKGTEHDSETIYISKIEYKILSLPEIADVADTKINGSAKNYTLGTMEIPKLKEVVRNGY